MSLLDGVFVVVLVLNCLWFGLAFQFFTIRSTAAARILVDRADRDSGLFATVAASVTFLGGMNFAFAVLSLLVLLNLAWFPLGAQRGLLAGVLALAHATQFYGNVPIALANRRDPPGPWPVLRGPMLFIFITDFILMVANLAVAVAYAR